MVAKSLLTALIIMLSLAACSTGERVREQKISDSDPTAQYFSVALAESFKPGVTTRAQVEEKLGKPYMTDSAPDGGDRSIYMHTLKKQAIYTFKDDTLTAFEWSEAFGHPALPKASSCK